MRKRTIQARIAKLYDLAPFPRAYPTSGVRSTFEHAGRYVLNRNPQILDELVAGARISAYTGFTGSLAMYQLYGHLWSEAHEYAHGVDYDAELRAATLLGRYSGSEAFKDAMRNDSHRPTRLGYADPKGGKAGVRESFADTIASTIVNDRGFIREHPAKYAYARALLKEHGVI